MNIGISFIGLALFIVTNVACAQGIESVPVPNVNFDANFFESGSQNKYGVIVLTGSGGGKADYTAERIASMGYDVLSLAYFDRVGTSVVPETLELIPLEYFDAPKKWLIERPGTRHDGVILYGLSKGAELALVLASFDDDYKAVVALAPSYVVWEGQGSQRGSSSPSSWSRNGQGLPFVPYISREERDRLGFTNMHAASLTNEVAVENAQIGVERINGPILLLSGGMDDAWPSSSMGDKICTTVNSETESKCEHVTYEDGDHLLSRYQTESFAEVARFLNSVAP
ncbi:MAG: dienelactone hydrolase [SAR86 cluster bacterium]|uniref:Dienelactone hydrolase n=1 Tax=SAR86 cluster bacterium TaxID=2030880 RepID=A0A2A4X7Y9_9GAMM|nr:MAG: dienelactone hydrolase [SAR86 cluster bacterium]